MPSFTPASYTKSVVLADGSRSPIQVIGPIQLLLFLYHLSSIYLVFLSTYCK